MKQILLFAAFFLVAGISVNAQKDSKSCDKPCTPSEKAACNHGEKASSAKVSTDVSKAMMAANNDENIEAKTCEHSGTVSFYKKDVCEKSGKVSYTEVEYSETNESFAAKASNDETPVAEATAPKAKKAECSPKEKASCSSKSSKASSKKDACCSSKASKASSKSTKKPACCSSKAGKKSCSSKS